jgi:tetratricopeptide (TPR) repeat protein
VHEVLRTNAVERLYVSDIKCVHMPDNDKVRDYLPLLILGANEVDDARANRYLGREYVTLGRHEEAVPYLLRAAQLNDNNYQLCETYIELGRAYEALNNEEDARQAYQYAAWSAPSICEGWGALATYYWQRELVYDTLSAVMQMLQVKERPTHSIICFEPYYSSWPYHMAASCLQALGDTTNASMYIEQALHLDPNNVHIITDLLRIRNIDISGAKP